MTDTRGGRLRASLPSFGRFRSRIRDSSLQSWSERTEVRQLLVASCFMLAFAVVRRENRACLLVGAARTAHSLVRHKPIIAESADR